MIRYALSCACGLDFEAWFGGSEDYEDQAARGLVTCPECGGSDVRKQIMAPALAGRAESKEARAKLAALAAEMRKHIAETHDDVGDRFAEEARAIHRGEAEQRAIYGEATKEDAEALIEEGAPVAPLPPAFAPKPVKKLN